ncbi:F1 sector of membrane-bound ATP synthase, gamma subunit [Methylacidimicrobium sp. AP8]|uniref:ATP synthase F1 subunit gamma n=1 Tax=Methylacidimicrobium sp. AP8 TaxID=2730359 RepID=UPI0018C0321A|nr:ATP synthase F1 subunit gamma [Methylacidimicrobium sp. AP8]CAB4244659.1 F1 sector of membrane-bound ATP synthase, gamma subunit [Methylacidimicrobium sp. AP8]
MASTREIRRRIRSVKNTAQITKAMQMVAASKMRRAQLRALEGRPYQKLLEEIAQSLVPQAGQLRHPLLNPRPVRRRAMLVISTDKGLCGALNTNLFREIFRRHSADRVYVSVGRKARGFLAGLPGAGKETLLADFELRDNLTFRDGKRISRFLLQKFSEGEIDAIDVAHTHFVNALVQTTVIRPLVPVAPEHLAPGEQPAAPAVPDNFEPSPEELLDRLLPFFVDWNIYQALLDSLASEHSARMIAMKNATENAQELVGDLTLEYNKARQEGITREILEIATAQSALE